MVPLYEDSKGSEGSVYEIYRFRDTNNRIANLGSYPACLPLILAGASVPPSGVIIELGPFAGFSSKCVALGLKTTGPIRDNALLVYDTYRGKKNQRSMTSLKKWIGTEYPNFTEANSNFLQLWKDTVHYVYPKAEPRKGFITNKNLYGHSHIWSMYGHIWSI